MTITTDLAAASWMDAVLDAANELATTALGHDGAVLVKVTDTDPPHDTQGAYVPLMGDVLAVQFGLVAYPDTCTAIVRDLLGMGEDEDVPEEDVADALGEVANILGGGLKARVVDTDPTLKLGLPVVIHGFIQRSPRLSCVAAEALLGPHLVWLVTLRHESF